jgi:hypothetical protein
VTYGRGPASKTITVVETFVRVNVDPVCATGAPFGK